MKRYDFYFGSAASVSRFYAACRMMGIAREMITKGDGERVTIWGELDAETYTKVVKAACEGHAYIVPIIMA